MRARAVVVSEATIAGMRGAIIAADARSPDGRVALRKGTALGEAHRSALVTLAGREIHVVELAPAELPQDDAAERLAAALAGPGVRAERPEQGQARLRADLRGVLHVRSETIRALNGLSPLLCFTQPDGQVVLEGDEVAGVKSASLATPERTVELAEELIRSTGAALTVRPFARRRAHVVATERLEPRGREMVIGSVERKLSWYGTTLAGVAEVAHEASAVASAFQAALAGDADLVLVSGANPLDPLDPVLVALGREGGGVRSAGVPAHPGSMVWVGQLRGLPVLGVATCAGFGKNTALDLLLPRVLAGEDPASAAAEIGHGGLAEGAAAAGRFPPYDRGLAKQRAPRHDESTAGVRQTS